MAADPNALAGGVPFQGTPSAPGQGRRVVVGNGNSAASNPALFGLTPAHDPTNPNTAINTLANSIFQTNQRAGTLFDQGDNLFGQLQKYLQPRLSGDRQALMESAAPEITGITDQYDSAFKAVNKLNPRAGGKVSALTSLRANEAGAVQDTVNKERSGAATAEANLFSHVTSLATSNSGQAQQSLTSLIASLFGQQQADQGFLASVGSTIGNGLGAALAFL